MTEAPPQLNLPTPDVVRARLNALDEERRLMVRLLRLVIRINGQRAAARSVPRLAWTEAGSGN